MSATRLTPCRVLPTIVLDVLFHIRQIDLLGELGHLRGQVGPGGLQGRLRRLIGRHQGGQAADVALEHRQIIGHVGQRVVDLVRHSGAHQAQRRQLLRLDDPRLQALAFGQVADRPQEVDPLRQLDRREGQLQGEDLTVLPSAAQLDRAADDPGLPRLQVVAHTPSDGPRGIPGA